MRSRILLACGLIAVALITRCYGVFESSIWVDDVWSIAAACGRSLDIYIPEGGSYRDPQGPVPAGSLLEYQRPVPGNNLGRVLRATFAQESHPPLFFLLLYFWMKLFGFSITSGRLLSLLFCMATLPVFFLFVRRMAGERAAWIACLFWAIAPLQSMMALQIRAYAMLVLLQLATVWLTFEILEHGPETRRVSALVWLGVVGMLVHYFFALTTFLEGVALLTQRRLWKTALKVGLIWTAVLAGLGVYLVKQPSWAGHPEKFTTWDLYERFLNSTDWLPTFLVFLVSDRMRVGYPATLLQFAWVKLVIVAIVPGLMLAAVRRLPHRRMVFLLVWLTGPVSITFLADVAGNSSNAMVPRYFVGSALALYVLLAVGLEGLQVPLRWPLLGTLVAAIVVGQAALRAEPVGTFVDGTDCRQAAQQVVREWQPGDLLVVQSAFPPSAICMAHYLPAETPLLALTYLPRPTIGAVVVPATFDTLVPRYEKWVQGHPHLWVARMNIPYSPLVMDEWLLARYRRVKKQDYGSVVLTELSAIATVDGTRPSPPKSPNVDLARDSGSAPRTSSNRGSVP